jgi:hypothetical protein
MQRSGLSETVEGFDLGRGGDAPFDSKEGVYALERWADAAIDALKWSQSSSSSSSSSSVGRFREKMIATARERFLDDAVVTK